MAVTLALVRTVGALRSPDSGGTGLGVRAATQAPGDTTSVTLEKDCGPPVEGPSEVMNATRSSPGAVVERSPI